MARKLLLVKWADHHSFDKCEWHEFEDFQDTKPFEVESVGWLMDETKDHLVIAAHCCWEAERGFGEMMILKKTILSKKVLR